MTPVIVDLCGGSGAWSRPYAEAGYNVVLVTLPDHDVLEWEPPFERVHGVLAAPPCTYFSAARRQPATRDEIAHSVAIVHRCLDLIGRLKPRFWAMENPAGGRMRTCVPSLGRPLRRFEHCDFGDHGIKPTSLWGRFRPPMFRTRAEVVTDWNGRPGRHGPPKPVLFQWGGELRYWTGATAAARAVTPPGFARAFFEANP